MARTTQVVVVGFALAVVIGGVAACASHPKAGSQTSGPGAAQKYLSEQMVIPDGGSPDSSYEVRVSCSTEPKVLVRDLQAGPPQATLVPQPGTKVAPGRWTYDIRAGDVDQNVMLSCDSSGDQTRRYDVDRPALFPGPTYDNYGAWRPRSVTTVVGTDCPTGTEASLSFSGSGGFTKTMTAPIDTFGNWEVDLPEPAPVGDLTATATCGDVTYAPLVIPRNSRP